MDSDLTMTIALLGVGLWYYRSQRFSSDAGALSGGISATLEKTTIGSTIIFLFTVKWGAESS
mgnify:CR=1 FL=1